MLQRGITLIEMMVVFVILTVIGLIAAPVIFGTSNNTNNVSWGVNGMTESRCIENYKFIVSQDGNARQILDEFGKGVKCETPNFGKPGAFGRM
jgi:prepilin-type N-terminal cleavage/methylation domain-containing protein